MTATDIFITMKSLGETTRQEIDTFFRLLASDTLENQIAMTLTANDFGTEYTTVDNKNIKVTE